MPCRTVLPQKPLVAQLLIQFPVFYTTRQFITIFPTASLNMVDARCSQASTGSNIDDIYGVIIGSDCVMCYNLKLELESVLQGLSSARKIIQILQDDVKKKQRIEQRFQRIIKRLRTFFKVLIHKVPVKKHDKYVGVRKFIL